MEFMAALHSSAPQKTSERKERHMNWLPSRQANRGERQKEKDSIEKKMSKRTAECTCIH